MAKKKKHQNAVTQKEFTHSPFKNLKGLSAFEETEKKVSNGPETERPKASASESKLEGDHSFADEMSFLGVTPIEEDRDDSSASVTGAPDHAEPRSECKDEQAEFLEALGSMEKMFKDEWPEDEGRKSAVPRRMKQVAKGLIKPQDELDLHGHTADEAEQKAAVFIQAAQARRLHTVRIIVGKGLHSRGNAVLPDVIEAKMADLKKAGAVLTFRWEKQSKHRSGALIVYLHSPGGNIKKKRD